MIARPIDFDGISTLLGCPKVRSFYLLRQLRIGGVSKTRLNSCTSRGGVRALPIKHVWEGPGWQAFRCPALYRRGLAAIPTPNKVQSLCQLARLHPPAQGKLYAATLSPLERRWEFFVGSQLFFTPGDWGVLAETGYFSSPTYETRGNGTYIQYWFVPTPCRQRGVRGFLLM